MQQYKNQLQQYVQRERLGFPIYKTEVQGPHLLKFKSTVTVDNKQYGTSEIFPSRKESEQAAAKVACEALLADPTQETTDEIFYKNLLQEFAVKRGLLLPSYKTVSSGVVHDCVFASTVEIGNQNFQGAEAKTKKQSQMNAAKVAYFSLTNGSLATNPSDVTCVDECPVADNSSLTIQLPATEATKKHHDISHEDPDAKRVKLSTESMDVNTPPPNNLPSTGTNMVSSHTENSFHVPTPVHAHPIIERAVENEPIFPANTANTPPPGNIPPTVPISLNGQVENSLSVLPQVDNSTHVSAPAPAPAPAPAHPIKEQTFENELVLHLNTPPPSNFPSTVSNVVTSQLENSLPTPVDPVTEQTVGNEPLLDVKASSPSTLPSTVPILSNTLVEDSHSAPADPITEQTIRSEPLLQRPFKIVVLPQNSNLPIPEGATVMPFCDDRWMAYKIEENQAPVV